jgi:hypothetical protein
MQSVEQQTSPSTTQFSIAKVVISVEPDGRYRTEVHTLQELPSLAKHLDSKRMQEVARLLALLDSCCKNSSAFTK